MKERLSKLERSKWTGTFIWVKAHAGILGNEMTKTASRDEDMTTSVSRIHFSMLLRELEEKSKLKWIQNLEESHKAVLTKQFYPNITDTVKSNIVITSKFTAMLSGHGKTRGFLHLFKLLESATCTCNKGNQTTDHMIYHCTLLQQQREDSRMIYLNIQSGK